MTPLTIPMVSLEGIFGVHSQPGSAASSTKVRGRLLRQATTTTRCPITPRLARGTSTSRLRLGGRRKDGRIPIIRCPFLAVAWTGLGIQRAFQKGPEERFAHFDEWISTCARGLVPRCGGSPILNCEWFPLVFLLVRGAMTPLFESPFWGGGVLAVLPPFSDAFGGRAGPSLAFFFREKRRLSGNRGRPSFTLCRLELGPAFAKKDTEVINSGWMSPTSVIPNFPL